ncbi:MAG TPA: M48 family metalloprotease [Lacipirellulaceae bacterium]
MSRISIPAPLPSRGGPLMYGDQDDDRQMFGSNQGMGGLKARLLIAAVIALFAVISYYGRSTSENPITGASEHVAMADAGQEILMGLQSRPEMMQQFGGQDPDAAAQDRVSRVGWKMLSAIEAKLATEGRKNPYHDAFKFTMLADPETVNAFALPGGQVFITRALYKDLETEGQLAGVLGHEIGHVIERHSNKQMAKSQLIQGLATAGGMAGGDQQSMQMAQQAAQMISMKYGREDELQADQWGVRLSAMGGYDPRAMIGVMEVLDRVSAGRSPPEFLSTHPKPANRIAYIKRVLETEFPNGVPDGLQK